MTNQYENRGVLFRNKFKQGAQPDYKGKLTLNGEEDQLSAWIKLDKHGEEFLSISRTPASEAAKFAKPADQPRHVADAESSPRPAPKPSDDIPF